MEISRESPLIFAKLLDGKGGAVSFNSLENLPSSPESLWLHFDANHPEALAAIRAVAPDIDEHSLTAIFDHDARPRTLPLDNGVLVILRGINHNEGDEPEDMVAIRMWVSDKHLISLRYRKSKGLMQVSDSLEIGRGPKSLGDVVSQICSNVFGFIEVSIEKLDEHIDQLETKVLDEPSKNLRRDISELRKEAIILRRYIAPQKEAINQLQYADVGWLSVRNLRRIQEAQDSLLRGIEELDSIRERAQVVKDELVNALSDRLNRNLYVLSVITAIFLPLSFLTGLFGINIGGMPGVSSENAFFIFVVSLTVLLIIQIALFKLFKWL
jgi:zinc transporter